MSKVMLWTDAIPDSVINMVKDLVPAGFELRVLPKASNEVAEQYVGEADYIICSGVVRINGPLLDKAKKITYVQKFGAGTEVLDFDAIRARGLGAANTAGVNAAGVAEHMMLLILSTLRLLPLVDSRLRTTGQFAKWDLRSRCFELQDKTVGIIGFGAIGQAVAQRLKGFNTTILYNKRTRLAPDAEQRLAATFAEVPDLLRQSDIVCLTLPLTPESRHIINAESLKLMKPTAYVMNTARGGVIDEAALIQALQEGRIAGAGLDVFDPEPPSVDNPLFKMENVVVTPHTGGATIDTFRRTFKQAMQNVVSVDKGGKPLPADILVNRPDW